MALFGRPPAPGGSIFSGEVFPRGGRRVYPGQTIILPPRYPTGPLGPGSLRPKTSHVGSWSGPWNPTVGGTTPQSRGFAFVDNPIRFNEKRLAALNKPPPISARKKWLKANPAANLIISAVVSAAILPGEAISEAGRWGSETGYKEDYVGGFVYGWEHGKRRALGGIIGENLMLAAFAWAPGGMMWAPVVGAIGGMIIGGAYNQKYAYERGRIASHITAGGLAKRKVQFGRGFVDSQQAYTMRQMAVQEMAGSLMNARQYLGNEAAFMHM